MFSAFLLPSFYKDISMMRLNKLVQDKGNEMKETIIWKKDKAAWKDMLTCLQKEIVDS